jgi:predicted dehydrogenase/nucleoside-diphosphate-sugar epimerase
MPQPCRVAIVGAGGISGAHVQALGRVPGAALVAVVEPDPRRRAAFAKARRLERSYASVEELIAARACDAAHVLVPPALHRAVAEPLLAAGVHVLLEKPMATSRADCAALLEAAERAGVRLAVNQNLLFNPAYLALRAALDSGRLGGLRHLIAVFNTPLFPLLAGSFGLWMFQHPRNVVFELGCHPLSLLADLGGEPRRSATLTSEPRRLTSELVFVEHWQSALELERCTAQVLLALGEEYPAVTLQALCDDGAALADFVTGRLVLGERTGSELFHAGVDGLRQARALRRHARRAFLDAALHPLGLRPDPAPFQRSMTGSVQAFYAGLGGREARGSARLGAAVVALCEELTRDVPAPVRAAEAPAAAPRATCDVLLVGGTGVIGRRLAPLLADHGLEVRVMARSARHAPPVLRRERIQLVSGDAEDPSDLERCLRGARAVVDLFHPSGDDVEERMAASARSIAEACLAHRVERLVYLSSTAALYLGNARDVVTGATPPDPRSAARPPYARGKVRAERLLAELARTRALPLCILRPGIVVGEGGFALHPGMGRWIDGQHCLGFNAGTNPMAFVLVDEVAEAVRLALTRAEALGKTYNVVSDVRLSAREYVAELARALGRPLRFRPLSLARFQATELAKWLLKRLAGRRDAAFPGLHDLRSRAMNASFDTRDLQRDLGWKPVTERAEFVRRGIEVHARGWRGSG